MDERATPPDRTPWARRGDAERQSLRNRRRPQGGVRADGRGRNVRALKEPCTTFEYSSATLSSPSSCRSEEHTSELQSRLHLVCRLLLEKKKNKIEQHSRD